MTESESGPPLRTVGRSALILTSAAAAVQVFGIVRELYVASQIGLSSRLDALLIALALPTAIASFLTSGMVTALVPAYLAARKRDIDEARRLAGGVLAWVSIGGLGLSAALAVLAAFAISIAGPGLSTTDRAGAIGFLQLLAPLAVVISTSSILYAICQAEERFGTLGAATLAGPAVTLAVVLVGWPTLELHALALANLAGPLVSLVMLTVAVALGPVVPRLGFRPAGVDVRSLVAHAGPLTLGAAILQINVVVDRAIASLLAPGAVSALRYAEVLIRTPISALNPAWSAAIYPTLVHMAQDRAPGRLADVTARMVRYAIAAFLPIAVLTVAVAPLAVVVAYGRGAFAAEDVELTTAVTAGFAPLVIVLMTSPVIRLALNARRLGRVLLAGAALNVVLNTLLDVVLGLALGVVGVALSSGLTAALVGVYFARRLASSDPEFRLGPLVRTLLTALAAVSPGALAIAAICWSGSFPRETGISLLLLIAFGAIGLLSYGLIALRLGLSEVRTITDLLLARLGLKRQPEPSS